MVLSYSLLIGGAMNDGFLRATVLRAAVPNLNSPVVGVTHRIVMLGFVGLWRYLSRTAEFAVNSD